MSVEIKEVANIIDLQNVKEQLLGDAINKLSHVPKNELPLQDCFISLSSTGDILALAWNIRIVILGSKWDLHESSQVKNKFHILWSGNICNKLNEWITSIICLPLIPLGKAAIGATSDWTCIAVGFNTGFLRFYTDEGTFLFETQLHNESVLGIKCQSLSPPRHAEDVAQIEELHVLYNTVVCVLQGYSLFTTLRTYRKHLAKVQASVNHQTPEANLVYKKWGFRNQDVMNDCQVIGTTSVNTFDHLTIASLCGGFNATYRSSAPQHTLVTVTGKRPFIGFHYILEGVSVPILSDVAIAMANKVANAIGSAVPWLRGGNRTPVVSEKAKGILNEPAEAMTCRFGLSDITREGYSVVVTPNKSLSVVTDAVGRVTLIDNLQGVAIRMWKGYRDAQCGWIEAVEENYRGTDVKTSDSKARQSRMRRSLFLVIYAPKKGVIDIWAIQHGNKIATFSAGKNGRLLYTNYGLFGLNDATLTPWRPNQAHYPCVFVDPLGGMKEIIVPFHFALSSQSSYKTRDLHLFLKLKTFMREEDYDNERLTNEITNICHEVKTVQIKLQILEMLISNKNIIPEALLAAARCFDEKVSCKEDDDLQPAFKSLYLFAIQLCKAVEFYMYIQSEFNYPLNDNTSVKKSIPTEEELSCVMQISVKEIHRVLKLSKTVKELEQCVHQGYGKVKFEEGKEFFLIFLSCFEYGINEFLGFRNKTSLENKSELAKLFYQGCLYSDNSITSWQEKAKQSNIHPSVFMELAILFWLNKTFGECLEIELLRYVDLIQAICSIGSSEEICAMDYNETSQWWRKVREMLSNSTNPFHALLAAMACRVVSVTLERKQELVSNAAEDNNGNNDNDVKNGNDSVKEGNSLKDTINRKLENSDTAASVTSQSSINEWENVSAETCQFSLLIGNLEDITILNAVVSHQPRFDSTTQFLTLPYEQISVSLHMVISGGKGSISETVAKWLSSTGVDPARLIDTTDIEFDRMQLAQDTMKVAELSEDVYVHEVPQQKQNDMFSSTDVENEVKTSDETCLSVILDKLTLLKRHFPYSLTSSVLLANLCWEYVMSWNKDVTRLDVFEAAVSVLRQIPMKHMRHGVCCLFWTLHIKQKMESAAKLMNKLGKLPKERLCIQDVGLSDVQLTEFLRICIIFLDIFLDAEILEFDAYSEIRFEELWGDCQTGRQPLATLAVLQAPSCYELIMLHSQLTNVLYMMAYFNLKIPKPLNNLFDSIAQQYFFKDITDKAVFISQQDVKLDVCRTEFLRRVITASMESIHQDTTEANNFNFKQAVLWMSKCEAMASIWKINNDELRIHQVCQLYQEGFDRLADEVIIAVNDTEKLAENLLPIAGSRIMAHLSTVYGQNFLDEVSRISPTLTTYLRGLDCVSSNTVFTNCTNDDTVELIKKVARYLPETSGNYHLVQLMLDSTLILSDST